VPCRGIDVQNRSKHFTDEHEYSRPFFLHNWFSHVRHDQATADQTWSRLDPDTDDNILQVPKVKNK